MAKDLFGSLGSLGSLGDTLGGLVSGLAKSGLAPKDDPAVILLNAQSEVSSLQKQEAELLVEIGRTAFEQSPDLWPQADKLRLIRANMDAAQDKLDTIKHEQEAAEQVRRAEQEAREASANRCPNCGTVNPDGVRFCQDCGSKLGTSFCNSCGAELQPGTRFCGACGARQGED